MNFKIKKEVLLSNLNYVSRAVSTKNVIPVLAGIKWVLNKEGLALEASDESIIIKTFIKNPNKTTGLYGLYLGRANISSLNGLICLKYLHL